MARLQPILSSLVDGCSWWRATSLRGWPVAILQVGISLVRGTSSAGSTVTVADAGAWTELQGEAASITSRVGVYDTQSQAGASLASRMPKLRKLLVLSWADRSLLLTAWVLVAMIRLGLGVLPFRDLRAILARVRTSGRPPTRSRQRLEAQVVWSVNAASEWVPKATCLTRALATQALLARYGQPALIHIGVAKDPDGRVEGHAWLEIEGKIVLGGGDVERFTRVLAVA